MTSATKYPQRNLDASSVARADGYPVRDARGQSAPGGMIADLLQGVLAFGIGCCCIM